MSVRALGAAGLFLAFASSCSRERLPRDAMAIVARAFAIAPSALVASPGGYVRVGALDTVVPSTARAPVRIGVGGSSWIELAPTDLVDRPASFQAGAVVFAGAALDTDVVWVSSGRETEELRVLRSPDAPATAHYRIALGAGVAGLRIEGDVIKVVDHQGEVRIATAPLIAIDARGVRRAVHARLSAVDELETSLDTHGLTYPIVVDPAWTAVAPMASARAEHTATLLAGDAVLVAGGVDATGARVSSVELFDPGAKTWTTTTAMSAKRSGHTATLLPSGKVLVVGGTSDGSNALSTAQIFDLASKTWSGAASMSEVRYDHTATLLPSGKVLVIGGSDFSPGGESATGALYDPSSNSWTAAGTMSIGRQDHSATLLSTGQVLVVGGRRGGGKQHSTAEIFDLATLSFTKTTGDMTIGRALHTATLLSSDRVLVAGGYGFDKSGTLQVWDTAEVFDLASKAFKTTGAPMTTKRERHTATALPGDRVLLVGGASKVDLYTLAKDRFDTFAPLSIARTGHTATLLSDLRLLVAGGDSSGPSLASAELLSLGALGTTCTDGVAECASGLCVDGVCCDKACNGQCEACDVAASKGTCSPVSGAPHGTRTACSGSACEAKHCDGVERASCAAFAGSEVTCAAATCTDGGAKIASFCDGKGACPTVSAISCAPYACGESACKTTCATDADCAGSNVCNKTSGTCVVAGSTCTADGLGSQPLDRSAPAKDCAPYRCAGETGTCIDHCTSSDVCAPGAACDATGNCVPTAAEGDSGGCALGAAHIGRAGLALSALAFVVAVRRRRDRKRSSR